MSQPAMPSTSEHPPNEKYALQAAAPLPTQSPEDRHLAERVGHALRSTGYSALGGVEVSVTARTVLLEGRVPSYYLKQVAQAAALALTGAHQFRNDLDVEPPNEHHQAGFLFPL